MYALLAVIPIIVVILTMSVLKQKSSMALFAGWATAILLSLVVWNITPIHATTWTAFGFLSAIPVLFVIFGAIFMLNTLLDLRFVETIGNGFKGISNDRRIQLLIIGWFFASLIEGAAGFGTPGAIAAPLLVALGIPTLFAAMTVLIANAGSTMFGAAGTPTTAGWGAIQESMISQYGLETSEAIFHQLNTRLALTSSLVAIFLPFVIVAAVVARDGRKRGIKDALPMLPLALFAGASFFVPFLISSFLSHNLPTLAGAVISMPLFIFAVKKGFLVPKEVYRFVDDEIPPQTTSEDTGISPIKAWMPYVAIVGILILTRLPWFGLAQWLNPAIAHLRIHNLFGQAGINWNFNPLWNPGVFPFIPLTLLVIFTNKNSGKVLRTVTQKTLAQLKHATIALLFGIALVQIMLNTNFSVPSADLGAMTSEIALALSQMFGHIYLVVSPFIGVLGSFISGSTAVSNIMFMGLQLEAAEALGIPVVLILISQTMGAAAGNMLSINNIVAVSATTGFNGKESTIMGATLVPLLIYTALTVLTLHVFLAIGLSWVA